MEAGETAAENADQLTTSITVAPLATGHAEASAVIQLPHPADALTSSARAISNSADGSTEMAVVAVEDPSSIFRRSKKRASARWRRARRSRSILSRTVARKVRKICA